MSQAPTVPSSLPARLGGSNVRDAPSPSEDEDQHNIKSQELCPNAKLRLHLDDLTHRAVPVFAKVIPLSTLIEDAIKHVQRYLFTPPELEQNTQAPPHQKPLPPKHEAWKPQEVRSITLILRPMDGVAYTTGTELDEAHKEIHLSLDYLQTRIKQFYGDAGYTTANSKADASFLHEIRGVVTHEMVHAFQHNARGTCPGGLIEGIADYVRMKSGLGAEHWNPWPAGKRTRGDKWDEGYQRTAWFLEWVEGNVSGRGAIGRLNEALRKDEWDDGKVWEAVIGKPVKECWRLYQEAWEGMNKKHENHDESANLDIDASNTAGVQVTVSSS